MQNQWPYRHLPIFQNMLIILKLLSPLLFYFSSWFIILKKNTTGHKTPESIYCKDLIQTPGAPAEGANPGAER